MEENENMVRGYCFRTLEDAETARQEIKKIEYLERHMDHGKPENMLLIYRKVIESHVFQTPVGWEYLRSLQAKLLECENLEGPVPPLALNTVFAYRAGTGVRAPVPRPQEKKVDGFKGKFIISILVNLILAVLVGAMFAIALTSDQPNILNYERALVNKYAAWEQELAERENQIREQERKIMKEE